MLHFKTAAALTLGALSLGACTTMQTGTATCDISVLALRVTR